MFLRPVNFPRITRPRVRRGKTPDYEEVAENLKFDYESLNLPVYETIDKGLYADAVKIPDVTYSLKQFFRRVLARDDTPTL